MRFFMYSFERNICKRFPRRPEFSVCVCLKRQRHKESRQSKQFLSGRRVEVSPQCCFKRKRRRISHNLLSSVCRRSASDETKLHKSTQTIVKKTELKIHMASSSLKANDMERNAGIGTFSLLYEKGKFIGAGICWARAFFFQPGHDELLLTEVAINMLLHKPVKCPNIVQMLDWFVEGDTHILIMEYPHPCQTLNGFPTSHTGRLKETEARHIMRQAVNAAKHFIDHNIAHGDLHRGNVLINTEKLELKLIDFGFSYLIPDTPCEEQTKGVADMVTFLCDLLFVLTTEDERKSFHGPDLLDNPRLKTLGLSKECLDLMNQCRLPEAADRPTLEEFLDHEWFKPD